MSNFIIFLKRLNWLASDSTGSSCQLVWSADFCDFGAQIPYGSCPYAPDQSWAVFWVHFGLCLKLHEAHHESMWTLDGEAS